jgi:hypothetical protein
VQVERKDRGAEENLYKVRTVRDKKRKLCLLERKDRGAEEKLV